MIAATAAGRRYMGSDPRARLPGGLAVAARDDVGIGPGSPLVERLGNGPSAGALHQSQSVVRCSFRPSAVWRVRLRPFAVLIVFVAAGLPNVLAGAFQLRAQPVGNCREARAARTRFPAHAGGHQRCRLSDRSHALLVSRLFGLPKGVLKIQQAQLSRQRSRTPAAARALELGRLVALISIVEWSIAACVYPISLRLIHAEMPAAAMLRFFFSLLLCGLVAAAYPFFVVTFFSLRSLYPVFVVGDLRGGQRRRADLLRKSRAVECRLSGGGRVGSVSGDHRADCRQLDQRQCPAGRGGEIDGRLQRHRPAGPALALLAVAFDPDRSRDALGRAGDRRTRFLNRRSLGPAGRF